MKEAEYLTGKLLLAMPGMGDPRFDHAVIAMCLHDHTGAFGIGVGQHRQGVRLRGSLCSAASCRRVSHAQTTF